MGSPYSIQSIYTKLRAKKVISKKFVRFNVENKDRNKGERNFNHKKQGTIKGKHSFNSGVSRRTKDTDRANK